jgi:mono/diheme cytochrome c family protein
MKPITKHVLATSAAWLVGAAVAAGLFVWSGIYNVGADAPHTATLHTLLETVKERSVAVRADDIKVPPGLGDAARIRSGAGNYDAMCAKCHLAPGKDETELSRGLYPSPPNLAKHRVEPAHAFWIIKHGIKASGMPAWGKSMKDEYIWDMAAFLQKLPDVNQQQYQEMVASNGGHGHGNGAGSGEAGRAGHHDAGTAGTGGEGEQGHHAGVQDAQRPAPASAPAAGAHQDDGHRR